MVVRVARQNQSVGQGFGISRVQIGHAQMSSRVGCSMKKPPKTRGVFNSSWHDGNCAGRNRTYDLQVMSLAS